MPSCKSSTESARTTCSLLLDQAQVSASEQYTFPAGRRHVPLHWNEPKKASARVFLAHPGRLVHVHAATGASVESGVSPDSRRP